MDRSLPLFLLLLVPVLASAHGCAGEGPPVAEVEIGDSELELPYRRFVSLDLSWTLREPLGRRAGQLYVFVHLLDEPGSVLRTFDLAWPGSWQPGSRVDMRVNLHQSALGPPLDPGAYALTLGLHDGEGRRWPLATPGESVDRHEYRIANVRVPPVSGGEPMFQFSPDWLESEPGRDRQVLARRWLTGSGRLLVTGHDRPGDLWLKVMVPPPGSQQELVLVEGASQQGVVLRSDCGGVEIQLAGVGHHEVVLPLARAGDADPCGVEVTPNFYLLELESAERRSIALDGLAWKPSP